MLITELKNKDTILSSIKGQVFVIICHGCKEIHFPERQADQLLTELTAAGIVTGSITTDYICTVASVDTEKISEVADRVSGWMTQQRDETAWMKECVLRYYYQLRYSDSMYVILWLMMFALLTLLLVLGRSWLGLLLMVCLGGGRSLIWVYLIHQGRFPERIIVSLYVIELLLLVGMLCNLPVKCKENLVKIKGKLTERWKLIPVICVGMQAVFVVAAACLLTEQVKAEGPKVLAQQKIQKEWNVLREYCESHEDTLYLIDVFSAVEYGGFQYETDCGNMMLAGGWMSASPLAKQRFESRGAADGGQALFEDTGTVFLAEDTADVKWLENYLTARFGVCTLEPVEKIVCSENKTFVEYHVVR